MAFNNIFFKKIISAKIKYKRYNSIFWVIVKAFKTWQNSLKNCKYKNFIFTNYNNLYLLIYINNSSFIQIQ